MGQKRSLSSYLSRHDPDNEEFKTVTNELHAGSDRVAAIMGAALVENGLRKCIEAALVDPGDKAALFLEPGAPFHSFKARIVAGRALGLYDAETGADLDRIRDIRNQFAHALLSIDFDNEHISNACDKIREIYGFHVIKNRSVGPMRLRYENACWTISLYLLNKNLELLDRQLARLKFESLVFTLPEFLASGLKGTPNALSITDENSSIIS